MAPLVVQTTTMDGSRPAEGTSATCGGCSPFSLASPSTLLTRTGAPNVRAASRLTATNTSVAPLSTEAPHATATNDPSAATVGVALPRPLTPSAIDASVPASDAVRTTKTIADHPAGDHR